MIEPFLPSEGLKVLLGYMGSCNHIPSLVRFDYGSANVDILNIGRNSNE